MDVLDDISRFSYIFIKVISLSSPQQKNYKKNCFTFYYLTLEKKKKYVKEIAHYSILKSINNTHIHTHIYTHT